MEVSQNKAMMGIVVILLVLFAAAVFFYNRTLNDLAVGSCTDVNGVDCPHAKVVETQNTVIAALIAVIALVAGGLLYQMRGKKNRGEEDEPEALHGHEHTKEPTHVHLATKKLDISSLEPDEKKIIEILQENSGSAFQSEIIKRTGYTKVKISRVLDRLEQKEIVERKRRGMANLVVLK